MNKIILMGRLTKDPEVRYIQGENPKPVARYSLAVDKRQKREDGITVDFFQIVAFDKHASFAEKYLHKGIKILLVGHVQTGSYDSRDGIRKPFFEVIVEEQEFAESKSAGESSFALNADDGEINGGYMGIPDNMDELPFK